MSQTAVVLGILRKKRRRILEMNSSKWILLLILILPFSNPAVAELYQWTDEEGVVHLQDMLSSKVSSSVTVEVISTPGDLGGHGGTRGPGFDFYEIRGETGEELWDDMLKRGRKTRQGVALAWCEIRLSCRLKIARHNRAFSVAAVQAIPETRITMPKWTGYNNASNEMQKRWKRFYDAVKSHEEWHKHDFQSAVAEVERVVSHLPAADTEQELMAAANAATRRIADRFDQRQNDFDESTDHQKYRNVLFE